MQRTESSPSTLNSSLKKAKFRIITAAIRTTTPTRFPQIAASAPNRYPNTKAIVAQNSDTPPNASTICHESKKGIRSDVSFTNRRSTASTANDTTITIPKSTYRSPTRFCRLNGSEEATL